MREQRGVVSVANDDNAGAKRLGKESTHQGRRKKRSNSFTLGSAKWKTAHGKHEFNWGGEKSHDAVSTQMPSRNRINDNTL